MQAISGPRFVVWKSIDSPLAVRYHVRRKTEDVTWAGLPRERGKKITGGRLSDGVIRPSGFRKPGEVLMNRRSRLFAAAALVLALSVFAMRQLSVPRRVYGGRGANSPAGSGIALPEPRQSSDASLEETIFNRKSTRSFSGEPLALAEAGQLLWAAAGKTVDGVTGATRAYPSAGGIYPLDVYLVAGDVEGLEPGVYLYDWRGHSLELLREGDHRRELTRACLGQGMITAAPASFVFAADAGRTRARYGERGASRYVSMDVGGAGQNLHLQAEALGQGAVIVGAFDDDAVRRVLGGIDREPLYVMPAGRRR